MPDTPGTKGTTFTIKLEKDWFQKRDIIKLGSEGIEAEVIKVYKYTWWKELLCWLGFNIKICEIKVKTK